MCRKQKDAVKVLMPKEDSKLFFNNYKHLIKVPWIISADIEAINFKVEQHDSIPKEATHIQKPCCIYSKLTSLYPELQENEDRLFIGKDCIKHFVEYIDEKDI